MSTPASEVQDMIFKATTKSEVWIALAKWLYKAVTAKTPFTDEDLRFYDRMCSRYETILQTSKPEEWALDGNNCPIKESKFEDQAYRLHEQLLRTKEANTPLKNQIEGIVGQISRLFESISKRKTTLDAKENIYRPDGFESMFLNDLAMWATVELPTLSITDEHTEAIIIKRMEYTTYVMERIFTYKKDVHKANPKDILADILNQLEVIRLHVNQAHQTASFNVQIDQIGQVLLDMTKSTFNILHLMLKDVDQSIFLAFEFLKPSLGRKENNDQFRGTLLGQWILETLRVTGIKSNDFLTRNEITAEQIASHISLDFNNIQDIEQIGFCDFMWNPDGAFITGSEGARDLNEKAAGFLPLVINLHRSILEQAYVREMLITGAQLAIAYGETWLFGDNEGVTLLNGLMDSLGLSVENQRQTLEAFWKAYYIDTYIPNTVGKGKDFKDKTYRDTLYAKEHYEDNKNRVTLIRALIKKIKNHEGETLKNTEANKAKKKKLTKQLFEFLSKIPGYDPARLEALRTLMNALSPGESTAEATSPRQFTQQEMERSRADALARLCAAGGYTQKQVPHSLYEKVYRFFLEFDDDQPGSDLSLTLQRDYDAAMAEAAAYKNQQTAPSGAAASTNQQTAQSEAHIRRLQEQASNELNAAGGYAPGEAPEPHVDTVFAYYRLMEVNLMSANLEDPELITLQKQRDTVLAEARAHKKAKAEAITLLCETIGYTRSEEIPPEIIAAVYDYKKYRLLNPGEEEIDRKTTHDNALEQAKAHKKARDCAIQFLSQSGGCKPADIPEKSLNAVCDFYLKAAAASAESLAPLQRAYDTAVRVVTDRKQSITGEEPVKQNKIYQSEELRTALSIRDQFTIPLKQNFQDSDFRDVDRLEVLLPHLNGYALSIYNLILKPQSAIASNRFVSWFHGYYTVYDKWKLLRQHCSRMVTALETIANSNHLSPISEEQMDFINHYLRKGLRQMLKDLPDIQVKGIFQLLPPADDDILVELPDKTIQALGNAARVEALSFSSEALTERVREEENQKKEALAAAKAAQSAAAAAQSAAAAAQSAQATAEADAQASRAEVLHLQSQLLQMHQGARPAQAQVNPHSTFAPTRGPASSGSAVELAPTNTPGRA